LRLLLFYDIKEGIFLFLGFNSDAVINFCGDVSSSSEDESEELNCTNLLFYPHLLLAGFSIYSKD